MSEGKSSVNHKSVVDPQTKEALKNLGFTDYYLSLYMSLLTEGEMNAHELSEKTGVPYSRIYEVLNEMIKQEMVSKIDGRPSTFIAQNPQEMLQALKKHHDEMFQNNIQASLDFLNKLSTGTGETKQINFTVHQGKKASMDHIRNFVLSAVKTLFVCFREMDELYPDIEKNLTFLKIKGVQMKFLLDGSQKIGDRIVEHLQKFGDVKFSPRIYENMLVADEKTGLQLQKGHFNLVKPSELDYMVFSSANSLYAMYLTEIFLSLWKDATA